MKMKHRSKDDIEEALHQHLWAIVALYEIAAGTVREGKYIASFDFTVDKEGSTGETGVFIGTLDIVHESEMQ